MADVPHALHFICRMTARAFRWSRYPVPGQVSALRGDLQSRTPVAECSCGLGPVRPKGKGNAHFVEERTVRFAPATLRRIAGA